MMFTFNGSTLNSLLNNIETVYNTKWHEYLNMYRVFFNIDKFTSDRPDKHDHQIIFRIIFTLLQNYFF